MAKEGISLNGMFRSQYLHSSIGGAGASASLRSEETLEYTSVDFDIRARPNTLTQGRLIFRMHQDWRNFFSDVGNPISTRWLSIDGQAGGIFRYNVGDFREQYSPLTLYSPDIALLFEPEIFATQRRDAMGEAFLGGNDRMLQGVNMNLDASPGELPDHPAQGAAFQCPGRPPEERGNRHRGRQQGHRPGGEIVLREIPGRHQRRSRPASGLEPGRKLPGHLRQDGKLQSRRSRQPSAAVGPRYRRPVHQHFRRHAAGWTWAPCWVGRTSPSASAANTPCPRTTTTFFQVRNLQNGLVDTSLATQTIDGSALLARFQGGWKRATRPSTSRLARNLPSQRAGLPQRTGPDAVLPRRAHHEPGEQHPPPPRRHL